MFTHRPCESTLPTLLTDALANSTNLSGLDFVRTFATKKGRKPFCDTDGLPLLSLTKDTDQVLIICISGFPSECLEDYHNSRCVVIARKF